MKPFTQQDVELLTDATTREENRASFLPEGERLTAVARAFRLQQIRDKLAERLRENERHTLFLPDGGASVTITWRGITLKVEALDDGTLFISRNGEDHKRSQWPQWLRAYEPEG